MREKKKKKSHSSNTLTDSHTPPAASEDDAEGHDAARRVPSRRGGRPPNRQGRGRGLCRGGGGRASKFRTGGRAAGGSVCPGSGVHGFVRVIMGAQRKRMTIPTRFKVPSDTQCQL